MLTLTILEACEMRANGPFSFVETVPQYRYRPYRTCYTLTHLYICGADEWERIYGRVWGAPECSQVKTRI